MPKRTLDTDAQDLTAAAASVLQADIDELVRHALVRIAIKLFLGVVVVVAFALGMFAYLSHKTNNNTARIGAAEREVAFRSCVRDTEALAEQRKPVPAFILKQFKLPPNYLERQQQQLALRLPIVDCSPHLRGKPAVAMAPDQQRAYISIYARTGLAPETEDGRVTGGLLRLSDATRGP
jgi:hypothetical protein